MNIPPNIPERHSSLLATFSDAGQKQIALLKKRSASTLSVLTQAATVTDWVEAKYDNLQAQLDENKLMEQEFLKAFGSGDLNRPALTDAIRDTQAEIKRIETLVLGIKKQKKTLIDDLDEEAPSKEYIEEAFMETISAKVMLATSSQKKKKKFRQDKFCKSVCEYYQAKRTIINGKNETKEKWCHVMGWQPDLGVKCAHLVPKSLESLELARFFGAEQTTLTEPRNGMYILATATATQLTRH